MIRGLISTAGTRPMSNDISNPDEGDDEEFEDWLNLVEVALYYPGLTSCWKFYWKQGRNPRLHRWPKTYAK